MRSPAFRNDRQSPDHSRRRIRRNITAIGGGVPFGVVGFGADWDADFIYED